MLVLTRKHKEKIRIGKDIVLTVFTSRKSKRGKLVNQVSIGIDAPATVKILRDELADE